MQVKKQQLGLDIKQWTGSKSGKEYVKALYCHPAYLTYMQSTSCEMQGWMKHKLESSLPAAAAAKSLQSCLTLCDPIDGSPPGSPIPGILQARVLEWGAISFSNV